MLNHINFTISRKPVSCVSLFNLTLKEIYFKKHLQHLMVSKAGQVSNPLHETLVLQSGFSSGTNIEKNAFGPM